MNLFDEFWKFCMLEELLEEEEEYYWEGEEFEEDDFELEEPISEPIIDNANTIIHLTETQILINSIKEASYTKKRKYDAEAKLQQLRLDYLNDVEGEPEGPAWDLCRFILESDATAAQYLTVENGYIYSQAIRENFTLPIEIPKEDRKSVMCFLDIFKKIMKIDMKLAVDIWVWCVKVFGPYAQFMVDKYDLYWGVDYYKEEYPLEFMDYATEIMCTDIEFSQQYFGNTTHALGSYEYITHALKMRHYEGAAMIERIARANPYLKDFEVEIFEELTQRAYSEFSNS